MSLFGTRDVWQVGPSTDEEYDCGSICAGNITNDPDGSLHIITGSFQGRLRVYLPQTRSFQAEDALLEVDLHSAILQLEVGRFHSSGGLQLAVLHPRKLSVYNVQAAGSSFLQLLQLYEHHLEHTAANMTTGSFGGAKGADYLCIQSYDGQLSLFEQERFAFARFLPNFLVPGPLCYCAQLDSFITCNAAFEVESYRYSTLAAASGEKQQAAAAGGILGQATAKKVVAEWKCLIGEAAVSISMGKITAGLKDGDANIVIVGEHTLFVMDLRGQVIMQKRLEYHPAACCCYPVPPVASAPGGEENLLVATHTKALLVYRGNTLAWSARTEIQPVAVKVVTVGNQKGLILLMDDTGRLSLVYLGTCPEHNPVAGAESTGEVDYAAMDQEHRQLLAKIRESARGQQQEYPGQLSIKAQVPAGFDRPQEDEEGFSALGAARDSSASKRVTLRLNISSTDGAALQEVRITAAAPPGAQVLEDDDMVLPMVDARPSTVCFTFGLAAAGSSSSSRASSSLPASMSAQVVATYSSDTGEARVQMQEVPLPLCLFCQAVPPVKDAEHKLTISTNRPAPPLLALCEDMLLHSTMAASISRTTAANVMSFELRAGGTVTILVSKTGGRYRLQSDRFAALWLLVQELCRRLASYFTLMEASGPPPAEGPLAITYEEGLPVEQVCDLADTHLAARLQVAASAEGLDKLAQQFRAVQKRLLLRYKDKGGAPLGGLDVLLEETYEAITAAAGQLQEAQAAVELAAQELTGAVRLLLHLARLKFSLSDAEAARLAAHINPEVPVSSAAGAAGLVPDVGWQEVTEAALTQLLRTDLAKSSKEQAAALPALQPAKDTARLRKHMALVMERLAKGMKLAVDGQGGPAKEQGNGSKKGSKARNS